MSGRNQTKGRVRPKESRQSWIWLLLIVIVLSAIAVLGYAYLQVAKDPGYDEATLCPKTGPSGVLVTLIDLSDPLTPIQANRLENVLTKRIDEVQEGTMISFGVVNSDPVSSGIRFAVCKPPSGSEANNLYQNKILIEQRFAESFQQPLKQAVSELLEGEEQRASPILESMHQVVLDTPGYGLEDASKSLLIVSDLYQHSDIHSFYRGNDWLHFASSAEFATKSKFLEGFEVLVVRIPRPVPKQSNNDSVEEFWAYFLEASGAISIDQDLTTLGRF